MQINEEKRNRGLHKQVMKKIDILEHLQELGYDIGYTSVCHHINRKLVQETRSLYSTGIYSRRCL